MLVIGWEQQNEVLVRFAEGRVGEDFVCIEGVRVAMVENATSPCRAFDMLIEFRKPCSQISLLKSPATINAASGCMVSSLHRVQ